MTATLQLIRHATLAISYGGTVFLLDPMLDEAGHRPPIAGSANDRRNPLVELPFPLAELPRPDALLVTHLHADHWDETAARSLDPDIPVFTQPGAGAALRQAGFRQVGEVEASVRIGRVTVRRTGGRHGTGDIGERMGAVSGFILTTEGEPSLYIAGDTIWCEEVKEAIDRYAPEWIVANAGGARFAEGDPITMDEEDIIRLAEYAPDSRIIAVHMDSINHCLVTRGALRAALRSRGLSERVLLPADGESVTLGLS